MTDYIDMLSDLKCLERDGNLARCESAWCESLEVESHHSFLLEHNRFRLRNLPKLEKKRPAVLVGSINNSAFPNFHTIGLLKVADVVSLTTTEASTSHPDRIFYTWEEECFSSICRRLPAGFSPDLFWDAQAAHRHIHPRGLGNAPCPTAAGFCHVQQVHACATLATIFDFVAPVGRVFDRFFRETGTAQVLELPFGLNWASFHETYTGSREENRDIDLCLTFSASDNPVYGGLRSEVVNLVEKFRRKWGERYRIEIASGLKKEEYEKLLARSRISINVVGLNGPHNYRTCEIINAGVLLLQLDTSLNAIPSDDEEIFIEGEDFVRFRLEDFEEIALKLLQEPDRVQNVAQSAKLRLENEFSYEKLYQKLLREVSTRWKGPNRAIPLSKDDFKLSSAFWHHSNSPDFMRMGVGALVQTLERSDDLIFYANLLAILPEALNVADREWLAKLMSQRDPALATQFPTGKLQVLAGGLFAKNLEHPALVWNFITLAAEGGWLAQEKLIECANANFTNHEWQSFDSQTWLLRHQARPSWVSQDAYLRLYMDRLIVPLLSNREGGAGEWLIHRDFLLELLSLPPTLET